MECENCFVGFTPQWRKINGITYCNSCGCHFKRFKNLISPEKIYAKLLIDISKGKYEKGVSRSTRF